MKLPHYWLPTWPPPSSESNSLANGIPGKYLCLLISQVSYWMESKYSPTMGIRELIIVVIPEMELRGLNLQSYPFSTLGFDFRIFSLFHANDHRLF